MTLMVEVVPCRTIEPPEESCDHRTFVTRRSPARSLASCKVLPYSAGFTPIDREGKTNRHLVLGRGHGAVVVVVIRSGADIHALKRGSLRGLSRSWLRHRRHWKPIHRAATTGHCNAHSAVVESYRTLAI